MKVLIQAIVSFFVFIVDFVYGNRSYPRFSVLETIARVPYKERQRAEGGWQKERKSINKNLLCGFRASVKISNYI
ncbi:oxidase [Tolypothrix sp. NIES-4075]|uniref:hypothetical protein n=1 Tax=Tolypothrix sp. NIES-4075 TaxID=2005459 RepID=UPI000B5C5B5C|nr:hypothetical protein [Tolypothrix sp. NIES-4075]GAX44235.1 oxidase [Tolypothrix sp. NIES-4075]